MKIIGLVGAMGSGKSTVATCITRYGYKRVRFSAPLKNMFRAIGLGYEHIEGNLKEEPCDLLSGFTPRYCMQTLGTEWARNLIDKGFWTNIWQKEALKWPRVVAEDCRFPNEAQAIRSLGGEIWAVKRDGFNFHGHSSETEMVDIYPDKIILNNSSIEVLDRFVGQALGGIETDNNDIGGDILWPEKPEK